ncbi:MAG: stage II sporulation protein E [Peptostreptococcaceae bacterium]
MDKSAIGVKSKVISKNNTNVIRYLDTKIILFSLVGFLLSRSVLIGSIAPLGLAFFLYISRSQRYRMPVFITTLAGILLSANTTPYMLKYSICLVIFMVISEKLKNMESIVAVSFIGTAIILPISIGQAFFADAYMYDILLGAMEAAILFISTYIFSFGIDLLMNSNSRLYVRIEESISISLIVAFSIMGIGAVEILGVSITTVLSTIVILIAAILGGASIGATSGVVVGIAFIVNNIASAVYMGIYAFAGLVGGAFNKLNKYFVILGYILSWTIIYAYTSGIQSNLNQIRDILIASLIVIVLPNKFFNKIEKLVKTNIGSNDIVYDYIIRSKNLTNNRLVNMYRAYDDLANTFDQIREKEKVIDQRDIASIVDMIHNDECRSCGMRRRCWELKFNHTYKMMYDILEVLEENGEVGISDVSEEFRKECLKPEDIVKVANYYYKIFVLDYNWTVKFSESRKLIGNQIRSISKSIESLSRDLESNIIIDLEKERNINDHLERSGISVDRISYMTKGNDDFEIVIEKRTCPDGCLCDNRLIQELSDYMEEDLAEQRIGCHSLGEKCKITFTKAQKYKAITEVAAMSRDGYIVCGDNYTHMNINDGKYMVAISDGMGKGKKAYEESSVTIDILEKMMDAKIEDEIVIETINNMLLLKSSDEEMFSTLDLGIIDLKKGVLDTIKMGACSTYIKRDTKDIDLITSSSLPVGILSEIKCDRKAVRVKDGDYIIMVSDGILDAGKNNNLGDNWLIDFMHKVDTTNPKEIANLILDRALEIQNGVVEDDMTVLVTKLISN